MTGTIDKNDPLSVFLIRPKNETAEQRALRERKESEARRVSERIDEELRAEKAALKKQRGLVKVLLLGQSESGKSTALKSDYIAILQSQMHPFTFFLSDFRIRYAHAAWSQERASWRAVVQLNLLRSIIAILETLQAELDGAPVTSRALSALDMNVDALLRTSLDTISAEAEAASQFLSTPMTDKHHILMIRLGPLKRVEANLKRRLGAASVEETGSPICGVSEEAVDENSPIAIQKQSREFGVRGWKDVLESWTKDSKLRRDDDQPVDDATEMIARCKEDMKALWTDQSVRDVLEKRQMKLQDSAALSVSQSVSLSCPFLS